MNIYNSILMKIGPAVLKEIAIINGIELGDSRAIPFAPPMICKYFQYRAHLN